MGGHTSELAVRIRCVAPGSRLPAAPTEASQELCAAQELSAGLSLAFPQAPSRQPRGPAARLCTGTEVTQTQGSGPGNVREKGVGHSWV